METYALRAKKTDFELRGYNCCLCCSREVKARHPTQFEFKADGRGQFTPQLKPRQVKAEERTMNDLAEVGVLVVLLLENWCRFSVYVRAVFIFHQSLRTTKLEKENPSMVSGTVDFTV